MSRSWLVGLAAIARCVITHFRALAGARRAVASASVITVLVSACGSSHVRQGDKVARAGDWESALVMYRMAVEQNPGDTVAQRRMWRAERQVSAIYTKRGNQANSKGRLGEAGLWWKKAVEASHTLERESSDAWRAIEKNMTALEYHGDVAFGERRWEDAIGTWGAVLLVAPSKMEIVDKFGQAQKSFASELHAEAAELAKRNLLGAALVTDLRALQHDPMQSEAFSAGGQLRRTMRSRTRIAIQEIRLEDGGYKGLAGPLMSRLVMHMEDFPPYGPSKDPGAMRASFTVTIDEFSKAEATVDGKDELENTEAPSTDPIPNPAIPAQRAKIGALEKKLTETQAKLKAQVAERKQGKPSPWGSDPGLDLARTVDETKEDLAEAKRVLGTLPAKVPPPPPSPTWTLPWKETTRSVTARVRFEVKEPDFPEPVVLVLTETVSKTDRHHEGNRKHGVRPDSLQLPSVDSMVAELAKKLEHGSGVVGEARQRRVDTLVETGRDHLHQGRDHEALDAFVAVLFLAGPEALPEDAAGFVAKQLEHDRFKDIVAMQ